MSDGNRNDELAAVFVQLEYSALRTEVDARSNHQHTLLSIGATVGAGAAVVAFGGDEPRPEALAAISPFILVFFFVFADHARCIVRLGERMRTISALGRRIANEPLLLTWEDDVQTRRRASGVWEGGAALVFPATALVTAGTAFVASDGSRVLHNLALGEIALSVAALLAWIRLRPRPA